MVEDLPKEVIDRYTMRLPVRSIAIFMAVASGVFMVYYFTSRANQVPSNLDRKSDLVWLKKILDENHHRQKQRRPGHVEPFPQYYDLNDYEHGGYDVNTRPDTDSYYRGKDNQNNWTAPRGRQNIGERPPERFHSKQKSSKFNKDYDFGYKDGDVEDSDWTTPDSGRDRVITNPPRDHQDRAWSDDRINIEHNGRLNPDTPPRKYDPLKKDMGAKQKFLAGNTFKELPRFAADDLYPDKRYYTGSSGSDLHVTSPVLDTFPTSFVESHTEFSSTQSAWISRNSEYISESLTESDGDTANKPLEVYDINREQTDWPVSTDDRDVDDGNIIQVTLHQEHIDDDVLTTSKIPSPTGFPAHLIPLNKYGERLAMDSVGKKEENEQIPARTSKLLNILKPHSPLLIDRYDKTNNEQSDKAPEVKIAIETENSAVPNNTALRNNVTEVDEVAERKELIKYPEYMNVFDWESIPTTKTEPKCEALQTISSYVRVCLHPVLEDPGVSASIKSRSSWEFASMRDLELAILQDKATGLIDIGAGIGEYSLAVASFHRHVVAVEPYQPHIDLLQKSVHLGQLGEYITLIRNVVSDNNAPYSMYHKRGRIGDVQIEKATQKQINDNNYTRAITLNQLASVIPFRRAVMKLDIPTFTQAALTEADDLFEAVDIRFVFTHWSYQDDDLNGFLVRYFWVKGYQPYAQLNGLKLGFDKYRVWRNPYVVWAKIV